MRGYHPSFMEIIRPLMPPVPKSISRTYNITRVTINPDLVRSKPQTKTTLRRAMLVVITLVLVAFMWLVLDTFNLLLSNLVPALANELGADPHGDVAKFMSGLEVLLLPLCAVLFSFSSLLAFRRNIILSSLDLNAMPMMAPVFRTAEQIHQDDINQLEQCMNVGCLQMNEHIVGCDKASFMHHESEKKNFERYNRTVIQATLLSSASCLVPLAIQAAIAAGYGALLGVQSLF